MPISNVRRPMKLWPNPPSEMTRPVSARADEAILRVIECPSSVFLDGRESVRTPVLTAHAMMNEEESRGVVFHLDGVQPRVMVAPKRMLPVLFEVVALGYVRASVRNDITKFCDGAADGGGVVTRGIPIDCGTGRARVGGRTVGAEYRESKRIQNCGVGGGLSRRLDDLVRSASETLVEVQRHVPAFAALEQCIDRACALSFFEQRPGEPQRGIAVQELPGLTGVVRPPDVVSGSSRSVVTQHRAGRDPVNECGVPPVSCREGLNMQRLLYLELLWRCCDPGEERAPDGADLLPGQSLADQRHPEYPVGKEMHRLAPMRVEQ